MRRSEAFEVLGLKDGASEEDVKKRARQLMKENHPDVNKSPDAEKKFKRINEAFETIKSGKQDVDGNWMGVNSVDGFNPFTHDFSSIFSSMFGSDPFSSPFDSSSKKKNRQRPSDIFLTIDLTFAESVLGTLKDIEFEKIVLCPSCSGEGKKPSKDACKSCGGKGIVTTVTQNGAFMSSKTVPCQKCRGKRDVGEPCSTCKETGQSSIRVNQTVKVPAGVRNETRVVVKGGGNEYVDGRTNLVMICRVKPDDVIKRTDGSDVESILVLSLHDAVFGCEVRVMTVKGTVDVTIPKRSRNGDVVTLDGFGVPPNGAHIVVFDVQYPDDVESLISK